MTAEVAILNASAIAIAADSAVTIGRGKKIYNSAIKVFALSKVAPVGVMIYGNAALMEVPWETILKVYRSRLGTQRFATLEEYAEHLLGFIPEQSAFFPKAQQDAWLEANIVRYLNSICAEIEGEVEHAFKCGNPVTHALTVDRTEAVIQRAHDGLTQRKLAARATLEWEAELRERLRSNIQRLIARCFERLPLSAASQDRLADIAVFAQTRYGLTDGHTGLVVCGFGEADVYPALVTHAIEGVYEGHLKAMRIDGKCARVRSGTECTIIPFAQEDMVQTFMDGVNPKTSRFLSALLSELADQLPTLIREEDLAGDSSVRLAARNSLAEASHRVIERFFKELKSHQRREHIDPVLSMVQVLPKDELASMAEAMVNLTAFKRRMTDELETVGGPIDVAVISKGDGLVWVKRKHYFDRSLNQHFFANYYRDISGLPNSD